MKRAADKARIGSGGGVTQLSISICDVRDLNIRGKSGRLYFDYDISQQREVPEPGASASDAGLHGASIECGVQ